VWIYLNDRFVREEEAFVSVFDHGFLYGDGVFEGMRSYGGKVFRPIGRLEGVNPRVYRTRERDENIRE